MPTQLLNVNNMDFMKNCDDQSFDLALVDPPYGIGESWKKDRYSEFYKHKSSYKNDAIPGPEYFAELFRISKNQIIWGGNYYTDFLPAGNHWIVWNKNRDFKKSNMSEAELAWHSFNVPVRIVEKTWNGFIRCEYRHGKHPHEKPVSLYKWLLHNYAEPCQSIIDTHLGSGSSAIAAHYFGCDFTGLEKDKDYFNDASDRFEKATAQIAMF